MDVSYEDFPPLIFFGCIVYIFFVVEARITIIDKLIYKFRIMMIPASTTKIWKKKIGLPHF